MFRVVDNVRLRLAGSVYRLQFVQAAFDGGFDVEVWRDGVVLGSFLIKAGFTGRDLRDGILSLS